MIDICCACNKRAEFPEQAVGQQVRCAGCGGNLHLVCGEALAEGAGIGDFDACLDANSPTGAQRTRYLLGGVADIQIGRLPDQQIVLSSQQISRQHCKLVRLDFGPSRWKIVDQNSALGVYVNGQRVTEHELQSGDEIQIGSCRFSYTVDTVEMAELELDSQGPTDGQGVATVCPSCEKFIGSDARICVGCGIHVASGRPLVTHLAIDENKLRASVYQWIRLASIFVRFMPLPMPIRSEVQSDRKPYAIWTIAAITIIASMAFFIDRFPGHDPLDFARPHNELLLWSPYQSKQQATIASLNPTVVRHLASKITERDRENLRQKYDPTGQMSDYQLSARLLRDVVNANRGEFHWYQLFTHMFLHDTSSMLNFALHLGGNMVFLLVLGTRVNSSIGDLVTAVVYIVLGVCAATVYLIFTGASAHGPMLGASGAIMGLAGMYLILFPMQRVICAVWVRILVLFFRMFAVRGFWVILIYFSYDVISEIIASYTGARGGVAHAAHIGGFVSGGLIALAILASRQFKPGAGDLPSMIFGKHVWPILGKPSQSASRRQRLQGSAIFAAAAAGIIPLAGVALAVYSPTIVDHPAIAMNTGADGSPSVDPSVPAPPRSGVRPFNPTPQSMTSANDALRALIARSPHVDDFGPRIRVIPSPPQIAFPVLPGPRTELFPHGPPQANINHRMAQARPPMMEMNNEDNLPEGTSKTAIIGLDGGDPYIRVSPNREPVIGFSIRLGNWGHVTIGSAMPLFSKPVGTRPARETICLAKPGYVVGGVIVNSKDGADGLQIIFMKMTDQGLDPQTSYTSQWFGYTGEGTQTQLDGNGKLIIGTIGRQGLNMNKIGLVIDDR